MVGVGKLGAGVGKLGVGVGVGVLEATAIGVGEDVSVATGVSVGVVDAASVAFCVAVADAAVVLLAVCGEDVGEDDEHPAIETTNSATIQTPTNVALSFLSPFMRSAFDEYDTCSASPT